MDGRFGGGARSNNRVQQDGGFGGSCVGCCWGRGCGGGVAVVGEVVVVFDGLEGGAFAEEAEVVNWDGGGEEGVNCCAMLASGCRQVCLVEGEGIPSVMPNPDLRIGTMARLVGISRVSYSIPKGVLSCTIRFLFGIKPGKGELTVFPDTADKLARASTPKMVEISVTRLPVSRVEVV